MALAHDLHVGDLVLLVLEELAVELLFLVAGEFALSDQNVFLFELQSKELDALDHGFLLHILKHPLQLLPLFPLFPLLPLVPQPLALPGTLPPGRRPLGRRLKFTQNLLVPAVDPIEFLFEKLEVLVQGR